MTGSAQHLEEVVRSATRARDLVGRILTFSRGGEPQPVPVDLTNLITEVGTLLRSTMPATIDIVYDLDGPDGLRGVADPGELHQVRMAGSHTDLTQFPGEPVGRDGTRGRDRALDRLLCRLGRDDVRRRVDGAPGVLLRPGSLIDPVDVPSLPPGAGERAVPVWSRVS